MKKVQPRTIYVISMHKLKRIGCNSNAICLFVAVSFEKRNLGWFGKLDSGYNPLPFRVQIKNWNTNRRQMIKLKQVANVSDGNHFFENFDKS